MRIEQLRLLAFGPFTDRTLDFSQGNFQVIYGPNEAGKSSTLRAIDGLLFGIPRQSADGFIHPLNQLRVGATLRASDELLEFVRLKKNAKTLVTPGEDATVLADTSLDAFLQGVDRADFRKLHCIDHNELRGGGEGMRRLNGLLGESLFAASQGGQFADVEQRLRSQAQKLYAARGKASIPVAIKEYKEAKKAKSDAEASSKRWVDLQKQLRAAEQRKEQVVSQQTKWDIEKRRLQHRRNALPKLAQWQELNAQLEGQDITLLPEDYSSDRRRQCSAQLLAIEDQLQQQQDKLKSLQTQVKETKPSEAVLACTTRIETLQQRVGTQRQASERLAELQAELQQAEAELAECLDELGATAEQADTVPPVRAEHRAAIQSLAQQAQSRHDRVFAAQQQHEEAGSQLADVTEQLESQQDIGDTQILQAALQQAGRLLDLPQRIQQLQQQLASGREQLNRQLTSLPYWNGGLETLAACQLPLPQSVERFADSFQQHDQRQRAAADRLDSVTEQHAQLQHEISASQRAQAVVTEADLNTARQQREAGWQQLRQRWEQRDPQPTEVSQTVSDGRSLEDDYHGDVLKCDDIADRLRREAEHVARLTEKQQRLEQLTAELDQAQHQQDELVEERQQLQQDWSALWAGLRSRTGEGTRDNSSEVGTPKEMQAWLQQRQDLLARAAELDEQDTQQKLLAQQVEQQQQRLRQALDSMDAELDFELQYETAAAELTRRQQLLQQRQQLQAEQKRLQTETQRAEADCKQAREQLAQWTEQWQVAMQAIECPDNSTAAQAMARVELLQRLAQARRNRQLHAEELTRQQQQIEEFRAAAQALHAELNSSSEAATSETLDPTDLAVQLNQQLGDAQRLLERHQALLDQQAELQTQCEKSEQQREKLRNELTQFQHLAGSESSEQLEQLESLSLLARQRIECEQEIRQLTGGQAAAALLDELAETDAAELDSKIAALDREIHAVDGQRDEAVAELTAIQSEIDKIDGNSLSAEANQRALNCLTQIYDDANRFLQLEIAQYVLKQQIEQYREKHQDPMLSAASEYFAEMTNHEFRGLRADYDEKGQPVIAAVRRNGDDCLQVDAMSDGTLDPLYLALRLAYLQRRAQQVQPMPLIVDDILIHLDDRRALATLQALATFSETCQILFFTHHPRIQELASNLPAVTCVTLGEG